MNTKNPNGPVGLKSSKSGSRYANVIPSSVYSPKPKAPSRRDKHRADVKTKKGY